VEAARTRRRLVRARMSDTLSSDALLLVLETVNKQAAQIK
jgi:hypothetical protein